MVIVAAVDGPESERVIATITQANELATQYGAELHIVHVGDPAVDFRQDFTDVSEDALRTTSENVSERIIERVQQTATEIAAEAADRIDEVEEYEAVGLVGDSAEVIRQYATEHDAEYIVVSGRKRSPLGQAVFGSVTQSLLLNADCPVVAVPYDSE